jgi:CheY-like chemotaxis protein
VGALEGCRVLIVEDEMLVGMELESLLQRQGCIALGPAPTVARALDLLEDERPDAVLLDLNLNGQSATEVAQALSARDVPFVLVTGYGEAQSSEPELRHAPRVDKPVNHRQLVRALTQLFEPGPR